MGSSPHRRAGRHSPRRHLPAAAAVVGEVFARAAPSASPGKGAAVLSQMRRAARHLRPQGRQDGDARVAAVPFGGVDPVYAMGSDGMLHTLGASNGPDQVPPVAFLPPSARPSALIWVDGMVYTSTSNECGAAPNAVWALDLTTSDRNQSCGRPVARTSPARPDRRSAPRRSLRRAECQSAADRYERSTADTPDGDAVVVLDGHTLRVKDWFSAAGADFNTSPIVIREKDRELIAAAGNDGRLYLLDGKSVGGGDHKTPLFVTPKYTGRRRRRRARHLGERRHTLDSRACRRRRSGERAIDRERRDTQRRDRRVQAGRSGRQADARGRLVVTRSHVTARPHRRQRHW